MPFRLKYLLILLLFATPCNVLASSYPITVHGVIHGEAIYGKNASSAKMIYATTPFGLKWINVRPKTNNIIERRHWTRLNVSPNRRLSVFIPAKDENRFKRCRSFNVDIMNVNSAEKALYKRKRVIEWVRD